MINITLPLKIPIPDELCKLNQVHVSLRNSTGHPLQKYNSLLFHSHTTHLHQHRDLTTTNHTTILFTIISLYSPPIIPSSGTSVGLMIRVIWSKVVRSGEIPPCIQRILSSISAATGRQLKQSPKAFQSLKLYRLLPRNAED